MTQESYDAIEVNNPKTHQMLIALNPDFFGELQYDEIHETFIVFNLDENTPFAMVPPSAVRDHFDHVTPGIKIKTVQLHR